MKYQIRRTSQFKKDYKQSIKRGLAIGKLDKVIELLAFGVNTTRPCMNDTPNLNASQCVDLEAKQQRLIFLVADFADRELDTLIDAGNARRTLSIAFTI